MKIFGLLLLVAALESAQGIEIKCRYYGYDWNNWGSKYTCGASLEDVLVAQVNVTSVVGEHQPEKTNEDVLGFELHNQKTHYLLQGLTSVFPNISELYVFRSDLKYLTREDFFEYRFLDTISLSRNHISSVPDDALADLVNVKYFSLSFNQLTDFPNIANLVNLKELYLFENSIETLTAADLENNQELKIIWLYHNKLRFIEPNVFDSLPKLTFADLSDNRCISQKIRPRTIESFKEKVQEFCSKTIETDEAEGDNEIVSKAR